MRPQDVLTWGSYRVDALDGRTFVVDDPRVEQGTGVKFTYKGNELELTILRPAQKGSVANKEPLPCRFSMGTTDTILLEPALPNHPLIIRPKQPYAIVPNGRAEVFIEVPLSLSVSLPGKRNQQVLISEIEFASLSKSWFGEVTAGELSYSLESSLPTDLMSCGLGNGFAICPITITNETSQLLDFQRMYLRVQNLTIYADNDASPGLILTDATQVVFRGEDAVSQITYDKRIERFGKGLRKIADPREPENRNVLKRSLFFIRSLTLS